MNELDLLQEIDELQVMRETLEELLVVVDEMTSRLAAKHYQLDIDFNS